MCVACRADQFKCRNTGKCVPAAWFQCDVLDSCGDWSDEINCRESINYVICMSFCIILCVFCCVLFLLSMRKTDDDDDDDGDKYGVRSTSTRDSIQYAVTV